MIIIINTGGLGDVVLQALKKHNEQNINVQKKIIKSLFLLLMCFPESLSASIMTSLGIFQHSCVSNEDMTLDQRVETVENLLTQTAGISHE